jgi:hypothetical protein
LVLALFSIARLIAAYTSVEARQRRASRRRTVTTRSAKVGA